MEIKRIGKKNLQKRKRWGSRLGPDSGEASPNRRPTQPPRARILLLGRAQLSFARALSLTAGAHSSAAALTESDAGQSFRRQRAVPFSGDRGIAHRAPEDHRRRANGRGHLHVHVGARIWPRPGKGEAFSRRKNHGDALQPMNISDRRA